MAATRWLLGCCLVFCIACDDTNGARDATVADATDVAAQSDVADANTLDVASPAARGGYLVNHVALCGDCHTPRDAQGRPVAGRLLAGVPNEFDLNPSDPAVGAVSPPNLTPDPTGLGTWTDAQIRNAFLNGINDEGQPLVPIMPYHVYHNMTSEDADAIVAYLRSLPPVSNAVPARQPLPTPLTRPADPVPESAIPRSTLAATDPNYEHATRGRYLAGRIGACMDCHTQDATTGTVAIDVTRLFAGRRAFNSAALGIPSPPYPATIYSLNITPAPNGIQGWTPQLVAQALLQGVDDEGRRLCPPMPAGPDGPLGGLLPDDALAIGVYLTTMPPLDNGVIPDCDLGDAGAGHDP